MIKYWPSWTGSSSHLMFHQFWSNWWNIRMKYVIITTSQQLSVNHRTTEPQNWTRTRTAVVSMSRFIVTFISFRTFSDPVGSMLVLVPCWWEDVVHWAATWGLTVIITHCDWWPSPTVRICALIGPIRGQIPTVLWLVSWSLNYVTELLMVGAIFLCDTTSWQKSRERNHVMSLQVDHRWERGPDVLQLTDSKAWWEMKSDEFVLSVKHLNWLETKHLQFLYWTLLLLDSTWPIQTVLTSMMDLTAQTRLQNTSSEEDGDPDPDRRCEGETDALLPVRCDVCSASDRNSFTQTSVCLWVFPVLQEPAVPLVLEDHQSSSFSVAIDQKIQPAQTVK